jgi:hypothetical protein
LDEPVKKKNMAKPTEPNDSPSKANLVVTIFNGKRIFRAPPFPSINASARNRANALNRWEKAVLTQMNLQAPVEELLGQLEHYIPIETASSQMKMYRITEEVYDSFFKIRNLEGSYFCSKYHEEILLGRSVKNRPAGLEFFRLTAEVNPATLYPYIREPTITVSFDLSLAQTPKTTSTRKYLHPQCVEPPYRYSATLQHSSHHSSRTVRRRKTARFWPTPSQGIGQWL